MDFEANQTRHFDAFRPAAVRFEQWFARLLEMPYRQGLVQYALVLALLAIVRWWLVSTLGPACRLP